MEVWSIRRSVSGGAYVSYGIAAFQDLAFAQTCRVARQMGIVVAIHFCTIKFVDGDPTPFAEEELFDRPVTGGHDRCPCRSCNVQGFVASCTGPNVAEGVHKIAGIDAHHRYGKPASPSGIVIS